MAIIDVVTWASPDYNDETYAWRFPSTELSTWTQLIVNESQEAVLYRSGSVDGPFGPGRHVLKTENLPILKNILNLPFGRSPFTADVWYVNKAIPLDVRWGTREPILLKDPEYKIMIPVVARGQSGIQIENTRKFLIKLVGAMPDFKRDRLQEYFKGLILTTAKTVIAKEIVKKQVPILEIATELVDLSESIKVALQETLDEFGLKLVSFYVDAIDVKEDDPSIQGLRHSLMKKADMGILGYTYQQDRSFNALEGAAGFTNANANIIAAEGNTTNGLQNLNGLQSSGGIPGAVMGLGLGIGAAMPVGQAFGQQFSQGVATQLNTASGVACVKCGTSLSPNAKFCVSCGTSAGQATLLACQACGTSHPAEAAFCSQCATPLKINCTKCGVKLAPGARFCTDCGTPVGSKTA